MDQYAYLIGCFILGAVWLVFYLWRSDLRQEILYISAISLPLGFTEILYVPEYWNPPSIFNLIERVGFGIEDFLFCFFAGGIAAVVFEVFKKQKLKKKGFSHRLHFGPYILMLSLHFILEWFFPAMTIYNVALSILVASAYIAYMRRDLIIQIIYGGLFFASLYWFLFLIFRQLFPNYINTYYSHANLLQINIFGIPIEEVMIAFAIGTFWSVLYEYIFSYKTKKI
jgi:hypothetical protein